MTHSPTKKFGYCLALAVALGTSGPVLGEVPSVPTDTSTATPVAVAAFELWGKATVEIADAISTHLAGLLGQDRCFALVPAANRDVAFVVEGSIHAEPKRPIVALRIVDPRTDHVAWSDNYDYTNITGEMMAQDIYRALKSGTRCALEE